MLTLLVAAQLSITPSAPPMSPAEAATVLLSSGSDRNMTCVVPTGPVETADLLPWPARSNYRPGDGPFGRFAQQKLSPYPPATPWIHVGQAFTPVIDVRIIEPRGYEQQGREPIIGVRNR